jgi:hypothetical protein
MRARKLQQALYVLGRVVRVVDLYAAQPQAYQIQHSVDSCWPRVRRVCQHRHTTCFDSGLDRLLKFQVHAREDSPRSIAKQTISDGVHIPSEAVL